MQPQEKSGVILNHHHKVDLTSDFERISRKRHKPRVSALGPSRLHIQAQGDIVKKSSSILNIYIKNESIPSPAKSKPDTSDNRIHE